MVNVDGRFRLSSKGVMTILDLEGILTHDLTTLGPIRFIVWIIYNGIHYYKS